MANEIFEMLECEHNEYQRILKNVSLQDANAWFDNSSVKRRLKKHYILTQGFACCYCKKVNFTSNNRFWDMEHILCESTYPQFFANPANLAIACSSCNTAKSKKEVLSTPLQDENILPKDSESYIYAHPNLDDWDTHLFHTSYLIYEHKTDKGKNLIDICNLDGNAAELAGHDAETVKEAITNDFFNALPNPIPGLDHAQAYQVVVAAGQAENNQRIQLLSIKTRRDIDLLHEKSVKKWLKDFNFTMPEVA